MREGMVTVYASTDLKVAQPLIAAFEARYPGIRVHYQDLNTIELNQRFLAETAALGGKRPAPDAAFADVLWSTAMDLQIKLVNDGHAQRYASPERAGLPGWAVWRDEAWGTTFERRDRLQPPPPGRHAPAAQPQRAGAAAAGTRAALAWQGGDV